MPERLAIDLATTGIGCWLPGGVRGPEDLWNLVENGTDAIVEMPPERWDPEVFYDLTPGRPHRTQSKWAGLVDGCDRFDAAFFGIPQGEAIEMDPQHRMLLQVA